MFIIVDNRFVPSNGSFDIESSVAHYHRLNSSFVGKYVTLSQIHHTWSTNLLGLLYAKSPDKVKFSGGAYLIDPIKINNCLEPKFQMKHQGAGGGNQQQSSIWESYLCDAIREISEFSSKFSLSNPKLSASSNNTVHIVILSNHTSLGLHNNHNINNNANISTVQQGMTVFCNSVQKLRNQNPVYKIEVHIISVQLQMMNTSYNNTIDINNNADSTTVSSIDHMYHVQSYLQRNNIHFTAITNSSLYYDIELKNILSRTAPTIPCTINIPQVNNMHLDLILQLKPTSMKSADSLFLNSNSHHSNSITCTSTSFGSSRYRMNSLLGNSNRNNTASLTPPSSSQLIGEPFSIVCRSGISPHLIGGDAMWTRPHPYDTDSSSNSNSNNASANKGTSGGGTFSSVASYRQNKISYTCLCNLLAKQDRVLILKFSVDGGLYDQYWALVPPASATSTTATSVSGLSGMTGSSGSGAAGGNSNNDSSMMLIRLVDSDHLFSFDDSESEDDIGDNTVSKSLNEITNLNLSTSYTTSIMATTNIYYDEDEIAETEEYLHTALIESLSSGGASGGSDKSGGIIDRNNEDEEQHLQYNPQACPSGTINYLYESKLIAVKNNIYQTPPPPPSMSYNQQQQRVQQYPQQHSQYTQQRPQQQLQQPNNTSTTSNSSNNLQATNHRMPNTNNTNTNRLSQPLPQQRPNISNNNSNITSSTTSIYNFQPLQVAVTKTLLTATTPPATAVMTTTGPQQNAINQQPPQKKKKTVSRNNSNNIVSNNNNNNNAEDDEDEGYLSDEDLIVMNAHFPRSAQQQSNQQQQRVAQSSATGRGSTTAAMTSGRGVGGGRGRGRGGAIATASNTTTGRGNNNSSGTGGRDTSSRDSFRSARELIDVDDQNEQQQQPPLQTQAQRRQSQPQQQPQQQQQMNKRNTGSERGQQQHHEAPLFEL